MAQLTDTGMLDRLGADNVFPARPTLGEAMESAMARAETLVRGSS
jgi:hypothetical protein